MLIQLLEYLQSGKTYSVQELAELLHKDVGSIQVELEYLENQGYIRKVAYQADCNHNCNGCHGCDQHERRTCQIIKERQPDQGD